MILLILLLLTISGVGQERTVAPSQPPNLRTFTEVKGQPEFEARTFEFSTSRHKYRILRSGRGTRTGAGIASRSFNLRLEKDDLLERRLFFAEYEGDVLLVCGVSDGEYGAGFITRLDGKTLRMKWKRRIPAFNLGQGLIEGEHAYVTAIGFVARVNLASGIYEWKHDDLYRNNDFNSFKPPRLEGDLILFTEEDMYSEPAKTIKLQKQSGKIVSIG
jgi:hypothetical protein